MFVRIVTFEQQKFRHPKHPVRYQLIMKSDALYLDQLVHKQCDYALDIYLLGYCLAQRGTHVQLMI